MSSVRRYLSSPASWIGIRCAGAPGSVVAGDAEGYAALLGDHTELPARSRFAA